MRVLTQVYMQELVRRLGKVSSRAEKVIAVDTRTMGRIRAIGRLT